MEPSQSSPVYSVHPSPPMDAIDSIREMYKKTDPVKQIEQLITFVENQLHKMKTHQSGAGSSSSDGWLETVRDGTELAAKTIHTISTEAEKLSDSDAVEAIGGVTLEIMNRVEDLHCVLIGLSVAAYAVVRYRSVGSTDKEWRELLLKILELSKHVKQYSEETPMPERERLCNAVGTIVEGALIFSDYLKRANGSRFWSPTTAAVQLAKINQQLVKDYGEGKDVFLSHSGKQNNFVRQLREDLDREDVSSFFDEDDSSLPLGQKFPPLIFKAFETCKTAVVVLSKEFIESKWPMLELSAFISAKETGKNAKLQLIPIFFKILPSELSSFTEDCQEWQKLKVGNDTRAKWQHALRQVRTINGVVFAEDGNEVECRKKVVKKICSFITRPKLLDSEPVGIEEQVRQVKKLLDMEGDVPALAVIVYGFGGIGKSTIADSAIQSLNWSSVEFKFCSVAIDEKAANKTSHIIELQKYIINKVGGVTLNFQNPSEGRVKIKEVLKKNKCSLLFIDNVVNKDYIGDLLPQYFEPGTRLRIIITSRDKNVNAQLNVVFKEYEVKALSDVDSKRLLTDTIVQGQIIEDKEKLMIDEVAVACRGVPLLLSVFGKHLRVERNEDSFKEAVDILTKGNLDRFRDEDLGTMLMFVYEQINNAEVKEAFLDICKYFHGWEWNLVADIVDSVILNDLHRRTLVSKSRSDRVIVHDILRLMGMKKAQLTRFSNYKEFSEALEDNLVDFQKVTGISLVNDTALVTIQSKQLNDMCHSLRVLIVGDWVALDGSPCDRAFRKLRYLSVGDIAGFPFKDPSKLENLKVFWNRSKPGMNLSHLPSTLKRISHEVPYVEWNEFRELPLKDLRSLKSFNVNTYNLKSVELPKELHLPASLVELNLTGCKSLPKDIGHLTALESLILDRIELEYPPQGFGKIQKLKHLSINYCSIRDFCSKMSFLVEELGNFSSLAALSIEGKGLTSSLSKEGGNLTSSQESLHMLSMKFNSCGNLKALPESLGKLRIHNLKLESLYELRELPNSFGNMPLLKTLSLCSCSSIMSLPDSFGSLSSLEVLSMECCANLKAFPESLGKLRIHNLKLQTLYKLQELPNSFGNMPLLKDLSLESCGLLMSLPDSFGSLPSLEALSIKNCKNLKAFPESLGKLRIHNLKLESLDGLQELPNSFGNMPLLKDLSLYSCPSLMSLPDSFGSLLSLEALKIQNCEHLKALPESLGKLRIHNLKLESLDGLQELPNSFGNMPLLKDLSLYLCPSLMSLPDSFGSLSSLETLSIKNCKNLKALPKSLWKLRIHKLELRMLDGLQELPNSFGNMPSVKDLSLESCDSLMSLLDSFVPLRYLKHMTVGRCPLLKELPHGFGALPALKTFVLRYCKSFQNLSSDFTELTSLEELHLEHLRLISRIPDGFGKLKRLKYLVLKECPQLKTLSNDFENLATLEYLSIRSCPQLQGAMMEKILKLQNCSMTDIQDSTALSQKWKHMHTEIEHPIAVYCGHKQIDRDVEKRAIMEVLLNGKCVEVDHSCGLLRQRSSLLVGLEEGTRATVALIVLPIKLEEYDHQMLQRFVEMATKTAKANGWGMLQIVCARGYRFWKPTPTEEEKRKEEDDICQILLSLPKGSCALSERIKILENCYANHYGHDGDYKFFIGHVVVDMEGRESFESFEEHEDEDMDGYWEDVHQPKHRHVDADAYEVVSIQKFISSLLSDNQSEFPCVEGESKTKEFIQVLKDNWIHHLDIEGRQIRVDDLHGKTICFIICQLRHLEWLKLAQVSKDVHLDSNCITILIASLVPFRCGHGSYTRLTQGIMPCAIIPIPDLVSPTNPHFVVIDNEGQIANQNAWGLLAGWGLKFHPITQPSILESFFTMVSKPALESIFHEMNIEPMKGKMRFLYAARGSEGVEMKFKLQQFTQIHPDFEVLYVGKLGFDIEDYESPIEDANIGKQEYEDARRNMGWPSLSVSDWIRFWYRCKYIGSEDYCNLYRGFKIRAKPVHCLASTLRSLGRRDGPKLVLGDRDEVVTYGGERVLQMICGPWDEISNGEGMEELIARLSREKGCLLQFVKTCLRDEIDNHPQHPQHLLQRLVYDHEYPTVYLCDVCLCRSDNNKWTYWCPECRWWFMCRSCWMASAKQQAEQLLRGKQQVEVELLPAEDDICKLTL